MGRIAGPYRCRLATSLVKTAPSPTLRSIRTTRAAVSHLICFQFLIGCMLGRLHEPNRHSVLFSSWVDCQYRHGRGRAHRSDDNRVAIADACDPIMIECLAEHR